MHQEHKNTTLKIKRNNLTPGLVASYDLQPANGLDLFSNVKVSNEVGKSGKISKEKGTKWWKPSKQANNIYIAPKSTNESRVHYAPKPARGRSRPSVWPRG